MDVQLTTGLRNASAAALEKLVSYGHTDEFIASLFDVPLRVFKQWLEENPQLKNSVLRWRAGQNDKVEQALFKRAVGCSHKETVVKVDKKTKEVDLIEIDKHYPPDTTACLSWLKNKDPENWNKEVQNINKTGESTLNVVAKHAAVEDRLSKIKRDKEVEIVDAEIVIKKKEEEERKILEEALF